MAAEAGSVAFVNDGLSAQCPLGARVVVAALRQVVYLAIARGIDQSHVGIVPSAFAYIAGEQPFAVGTPLEPQVTVAIRIVVIAIEHCAHLTGGQIEHAQRATVFEESHFLSVRAELRL